MIVVKELEPDLPHGTVTWRSNLNIISFPHFRLPACEVAVKTLPNEYQSGMKQSNRRKCCKVKTISTQTEFQPQPTASQPGVRYMDTSPRKELFDSFSSLSSVDCTIEQQSLQQEVPQRQHKQLTNLINSVTMETTKKHLIGKNSQLTSNKKHKTKKEKIKANEDYDPSLSNAKHATMTIHKITKDSSSVITSSPVHQLTTTGNSVPCTNTDRNGVITAQHSLSLTPTSIPSSDMLTQKQSHSSDTLTHHTQKQPHSSDILTHHTQKQSHSSDTLTHHTQKQSHSSDTSTHHTQKQSHSSDTLTHHTQKQPHSSDTLTHHTQEQLRIIERVKHWSKFEQLKAKYLPQSVVHADNHVILHSRSWQNRS